MKHEGNDMAKGARLEGIPPRLLPLLANVVLFLTLFYGGFLVEF
jgi:hypothetical protein